MVKIYSPPFRSRNIFTFSSRFRFFLILIFSCGINTNLYAQNKVDSLNRLIQNAKTDTGKINLLIKKTTIFEEINLDSGQAVGSQAINYAITKKYQKGEALARTAMSIILCLKGNFVAAKSNLVSAHSIFIKLNDLEGLAKIYSSYGMFYGMQSKYDTSIIFYKKSIEYDNKIHDEKSVNRSYSNIAVSYQMQSNYSLALVYFQKALKYAESRNDETNQSYIWENLGSTYDVMEDYARAEQAFSKP